MNFGKFDDAQREYVITNPRTPTKWINYIGTLQFGGFVDHTGGALLCKEDPTFNRITKYLQQLPSSEFKGETLYLRLKQTDGYKVFSPFFVPTLDPYQHFECHIGLGYSRIISEFYGIRTEATIFVPVDGDVEVRQVSVTNLSTTPVKLDAIPVVEYTHPNALLQFTNADWLPQTMQSRAAKHGDLTILLQYPFMTRDTKVNYFTSNIPASSFETDRKQFLGDNEYGTWANPLALQKEALGNGEANRGDTIAALLLPLGTLAAGETRTFVTLLGQEASLEAARPLIARWSQAAEIEGALGQLKTFWDEYLATMQVNTPDPAMNAMLNIHNPHQCFVTRTWSRYLSYYQLGLGSRGIGIRDSTQDVLAVIPAMPENARSFLKTLLSFQRRNGSAIHQFNPLTMEGSEGDSLEMEDRPHYYSDDHLWSLLGVSSYLKETGDFSLLDEIAPFYDKDKQGQAIESGTVLEHLARALRFTRGDVGAHGLPLLGFADWNDTVNLAKGAESLFSAHLYGRALTEFIALLQRVGKDASDWVAAYQKMKASVEQFAWDGEWYMMYFDHDGSPLGSQKNEKGKIQLNGQSWAVLSGFASPDRARKAMDSVYKRLNTKYGIKLSTPGYNGYDARLGGVTTYPPGTKENGGIFLHPNPWAVIAETLLGNGDRAYEYYAQLNPAAKNDIMEIYESEPYVYPQNILGDEHPQFGLARNSWLSGTASWMYQAGTQWILGIRPEYDGLRVAPIIPAAWPGFSATRKFRGATYHIQVERKGRDNLPKLKVNGKAIEGNIVPIASKGQIVEVLVDLN
jgi:cellobiose phosphorylase